MSDDDKAADVQPLPVLCEVRKDPEKNGVVSPEIAYKITSASYGVSLDDDSNGEEEPC